MLNSAARSVPKLHASGISPVGAPLLNNWSAPQLLDLVDVVSSVSDRLMAASAGAIEAEIRLGLEQVRELFAVDRCALYRVMTDEDAIEIVSQAAAPGAPPLPNSIFARACATSLSRVIRGAETPASSSFDALPASALADRIFYENLKIAALLAIPLSVAGSSNYVLCVTSPRSMEEWPRDLIAGLRLLGQAFANGLLRAYAEEALRHAEQALATDTRRAHEEMRELRMQLWHADRVARSGVLSASLAHELRQPLAAILSNAQAALRLFLQGQPDLAEIEQILQDIVHDDKRASEVIASVRTMLRRRETDHEPVDLARAVDELLVLLRSEITSAHAEIEVEIEPGVHIVANRCQMQQVVLNLVMNALEAMREVPATERRMSVSVVRTDTGKVRCAVRDRGLGIAHENLQKVFDPFWTTKPQGLGMGLSVCRSIVEAHNGKIWVESSAGAGTTFFFEVPAAKDGTIARAVTAEEHAVPAPGTHQADATVLVVDDDPSVRAAVARLVQAAGWKVQQFDSPRQLLDMPPIAGTGCVVLDVQMPGMTGPQFHDRMSERGSDFPVVYLTGHGDVPTSVRAMKKGAVDFLLKPVDERMLLQAIRNALGRHAETRARTGERERLATSMRRLSPRERVVMEHVVLGHANKRIAFDLGITEYTVKVHRSRMMQKMQVRSVAELVRLCEGAGVRTDEIRPETQQ